MRVVPEMQKVRDWLKENKLLCIDRSTEMSSCFWICRTFTRIGQFFEISIINGYGTYGGYDPFLGKNKELLEMRIGQGEPIGYLTAEEVIKKLEQLKR